MIKSDWIELATPKHFSFSECYSFLDKGFDDCMFVLGRQSVSRLHQFQDEPGLIAIELEEEIFDINIKEAKAFVVE